MPLYHYQAIDRLGKKHKGLIEAQSERDAKEKLRLQGEMVASLSTRTSVSSKENLTGDNLLNFTILLSQLVSAGIPLYESLIAIEEQYRRESFHRVIMSLCEQIKAGSSLSSAMSNFPDSFDKLYRGMIAAGESSGSLDIVLDRLCFLIKRSIKFKKQIGTAMIYPLILASFSFLIVIMLLGFVVPSIEGIFEGRELNTFTATVINVSHFFRDYWWLYIPVFFGAIFYLIYKIRSPAGKLWIQRNFLKVPLIKTLMVQAAIARFCRTMGTMQQGGMTIMDSLKIARDVMQNVVLEKEIELAEGKIIEGSSLSAEIGRSKWFPPMVARMLAVGEDSGSTVIMLNKIADMYEEELEKSLDRVMALAQPVILIGMGTVIGFILMAILLPLTDISSLSM